MDAIPWIPDWLEWYFALSLFASAFVAFVLTAVSERPRRSANPRERRGAGQDTPALRDLRSGDGAHEEGESPNGDRHGSPSHIQKRQRSNRAKRISFQTQQENDARLRLYVERRRLVVMEGEDK